MDLEFLSQTSEHPRKVTTGGDSKDHESIRLGQSQLEPVSKRTLQRLQPSHPGH